MCIESINQFYRKLRDIEMMKNLLNLISHANHKRDYLRVLRTINQNKLKIIDEKIFDEEEKHDIWFAYYSQIPTFNFFKDCKIEWYYLPAEFDDELSLKKIEKLREDLLEEKAKIEKELENLNNAHTKN